MTRLDDIGNRHRVATEDVWDMVGVLRALSALHVRADGSKTGNKIINLCSCGEYWPCETRQLIDVSEKEE